MSNFTFLTPNWPDLCATAREAEQNVASTPLSHQASITKSQVTATEKLKLFAEKTVK